MLFELTPKFDSRKSFYGKALIRFEGDLKLLFSFDTPVVYIGPDRLPVMLNDWDYSQTTLRHVKEFLKQNDLKAESLEQMRRDYA